MFATEVTAELLLTNIKRFLGPQPMIRTADEREQPLYEALARPVLPIGCWEVTIRRNGRVKWDAELALAALRRAGAEPPFVAYPEISYTVSDEIVGVDYFVEQWLRRKDFSEEIATLDARTVKIEAINQRIAEEAAKHPENRRAVAQMRRQREIEAALPTHEVDAWIVETGFMGYTAASYAALGKATRRDRRREARRQMGS